MPGGCLYILCMPGSGGSSVVDTHASLCVRCSQCRRHIEALCEKEFSSKGIRRE
jgi:hypothetical protein